ncbi:MAG: DNA gyrase/topoisomerase IV subunit A, partial [Muribaculaceae bacterium]|nr:DNA gyrase/topoisomerase IV subunit A [Muribaculaceae bacterium]
IKDSIVKAAEKGKIKIRAVEDITAQTAYILVHLLPGTSSDKAIDGLYAFTDCEISVSPNCCVINDKKPHFLGVSDVLRHNVERTRELLHRELEIQLGEVNELLHFASLERLFIENRIYKDREFENGETMDAVMAHVRSRLQPLLGENPVRPISDDDLTRLMEIKMKRILKFSSLEADRLISSYHDRIADISDKIEHITAYTIGWFEALKAKYGDAYPRRTVIRGFDNIEAANVAEANERLCFNRVEGFIGTALKKDENTEFVSNCSMMDDIILFYKDGRYKVVKVAEKLFVDKNVIHIAVFKRNDKRTIYNVIYQDGRGGTYYMKRFAVTGITRDREYNLTQGKDGSKVVWFSANSNGEAEVVNVTLKPKARLKTLQIDVDFSELAIKGRQSQGNIVTRNEVHRFSLKKKGASTLGGRMVWWDPDVLRINYDGRGVFMGEFGPTDLVLVVTRDGQFYTTSFDAGNHFDDNILIIEKFRPGHVWTAVLNDADQGYPYIKRFAFEPSARKQRYLGENTDSTLILLSDKPGARFSVTLGGDDAYRGSFEIDAEEFIAVKSFKAKGKRLTNFNVAEIVELDPRPDAVEELVDPADETDDEKLIEAGVLE